ncbi:DUF3488 and transglutaminase-like domain-containing protein [Deinococcus soli (ex Cha et al. 2016)]|uniref:Transglutaminase-like putative cysteine protease n=2 Tax=Deinococcus soli (ex Cha et al. 2016) TaxID=1309411 RepID=A0AAE3XCP2_9DEIO|nr:DUF3488 and transglutaminase-like domain-containing protein [Deinococcus soli (ex Cha et al. 2016)]MDR6218229.1 transglutaminase-like putative cysteine protease [Deinococcus soli (ex Cha et al. 2016)]MDR6328969.1 transglutaminase-like putative cysteine protease [Deinococcus soli (ex Cha et al. 2016)]MDR6751242.1 transglutaminase-like putative cysteine protease [Deinococcus soli (ex Cha et al. 2016)]
MIPPRPAPLLATLVAVALACFPAAFHLPPWAYVTLSALLAYRMTALVRGWAAPPAALLLLITGGLGWSLYREYHALIGRDGGTAALLMLIVIKALEAQPRARDGRVLLLLGAFMTTTHFFYSQDVLPAAHALLSALGLLCAATLWARPVSAAGPRPWRVAARLIAQATPLTLALFVLYPRPDGPLWQMPLPQQQANTGLSDSVTPGSVSALAENTDVAFRAAFSAPVANPGNLYWRAFVLDNFDGRSWSRLEPDLTPPDLIPAGPRLRYTLTLEGQGGVAVPALDLPLTPGGPLTLDSRAQLTAPAPVTTRTRYDLSATAQGSLGARSDPRRAVTTALPDRPGSTNPRTRALAASWAGLRPEARVQAALTHLRRGGYVYTLRPPRLPDRDAMDALLFRTRQGFCEHYASAFVYLMRASGVPARLVTGYLGGQGVGPYVVVRQAEAHAWAEVWLDGRGWVRVDPTAAVAPSRVTEGVDEALADGDGSGPRRTRGVLLTLRLQLDALEFAWSEYVINFDALKQQSLLAQIGLHPADTVRYTLALLGTALLALLPVLLRRRAARPDAAVRAYDRWCAQYARLGCARAIGETPEAYARRLTQARPHEAAHITAVTETYVTLRYAPDTTSAHRLAFLHLSRRRPARPR